MAADAGRLSQPFSRDSLPMELRSATTVFLVAQPNKPYRRNELNVVAPPITRVVLKSMSSEGAVAQPTDVLLAPVEWPEPGRCQALRHAHRRQ